MYENLGSFSAKNTPPSILPPCIHVTFFSFIRCKITRKELNSACYIWIYNIRKIGYVSDVFMYKNRNVRRPSISKSAGPMM